MTVTNCTYKNDYFNVIGAFLVIGLFLKFFYFLRIFDKTAYLIRIITNITYDVQYFLYILIIAILGIANGFLILSRTNPPESQYVTSITDSIFYTYRMIIGDFDVNKFGEKNVTFSKLVFILATILVMILLLNILIAIMSDTYAEIK